MDVFLWVIVPYLCMTTFVVGHSAMPAWRAEIGAGIADLCEGVVRMAQIEALSSRDRPAQKPQQRPLVSAEQLRKRSGFITCRGERERFITETGEDLRHGWH